jgi:signal transduction histidine kinase
MPIMRHIAVTRRRDFLFAAILFISGVVLFIATGAARSFPAAWQMKYEALHAVIETLGCMMALGITSFLLIRQGEEGNAYKLWPGCAMLSMAILDAFHASVTPGRESVFLHSAAQFIGGVFVALTWLPERFARKPLASCLPKALATGCGLLGIASLLLPEMLPAMVSDGRFALVPQLLNFTGGVLFLAGLAYFARRFCRDRDNIGLLFTMYCLLFAAAGLTFRLSGLWGVGWWLSHAARLGAYVVAFGSVSIGTSADYRRILRTEEALRKAHDELESRVEQRTAELATANAALGSEIAEREKAECAMKDLNEYLESNLQKLERANKELQEFAYIAAHDLKTPLRGIGTLAHWISTDYAEKFDQQGKENVRLLTTRAKRMSDMIDGILRYSSLGRGETDKQHTDLNAVLSEVISSIGPPEHIEIRIAGPLPTLICERTQAVQIFQNLIGNAVKYLDKPRGLISVGCVERDDAWTFSVSDNGPGIHQKYFEKIFKIFQTLAPRDGSENTGIGLAIVKKIAELNGGKVWVESKPGEGSTFFFTLPKPIEN